MTKKSKFAEMLDNITEDDINKALIEVKKEQEEILNIFLWKINSILEWVSKENIDINVHNINTVNSSNPDTIHLIENKRKSAKLIDTISWNIINVKEKIKELWWDFKNSNDFERKSDCFSEDKIKLEDYLLKLEKIKI